MQLKLRVSAVINTVRLPKGTRMILILLIFYMSGICQNADIDLLDKINNSDVSSVTYKSFHFITKSLYPTALGVPIVLLGAGFIGGIMT